MSRKYRIFAYGTLQLPEVMQAVTGARFPTRPARLTGYARYCIAGRAYPGVRSESAAVTDGMLYSEVDVAALRRLDDFEDDFYRRETLLVIPDSGVAVEAEVYVIPPERYHLLIHRPWDLGEFRQTALPEFLVRCRSGW
jgi:gamma-glutamylcyclotransferase (GGCT)/AIG2-like uncharacterized protein YtfP